MHISEETVIFCSGENAMRIFEIFLKKIRERKSNIKLVKVELYI